MPAGGLLNMNDSEKRTKVDEIVELFGEYEGYFSDRPFTGASVDEHTSAGMGMTSMTCIDLDGELFTLMPQTVTVSTVFD